MFLMTGMFSVHSKLSSNILTMYPSDDLLRVYDLLRKYVPNFDKEIQAVIKTEMMHILIGEVRAYMRTFLDCSTEQLSDERVGWRRSIARYSEDQGCSHYLDPKCNQPRTWSANSWRWQKERDAGILSSRYSTFTCHTCTACQVWRGSWSVSAFYIVFYHSHVNVFVVSAPRPRPMISTMGLLLRVIFPQCSTVIWVKMLVKALHMFSTSFFWDGFCFLYVHHCSFMFSAYWFVADLGFSISRKGKCTQVCWLEWGRDFQIQEGRKAWRDPLHTVTPCTIAYATFIVSVSPLSFRCMIDIVFHSSFAILFLLQTTAALMKAVLSNRMCLMRLLRFLKTRSISMNLL